MCTAEPSINQSVNLYFYGSKSQPEASIQTKQGATVAREKPHCWKNPKTESDSGGQINCEIES